VRFACLEEIALVKGWITPAQALALGERQASSGYGDYVVDVARRAGA
jgi:glucose-1-phosphate thymidylyltransferase